MCNYKRGETALYGLFRTFPIAQAFTPGLRGAAIVLVEPHSWGFATCLQANGYGLRPPTAKPLRGLMKIVGPLPQA